MKLILPSKIGLNLKVGIKRMKTNLQHMEDLSHYNPEGSVLRKAQLRLQEMLDVFAEICDRHNITYWIACGTLLGARRHGGFIPWDDDLDLVVLQSDYERLLSLLETELPEKFKLQTRSTDKKYWPFYAKIRDTKSRLYQKKLHDFKYLGLFIDIHPIEPVPSMPFKKLMDKFLLAGIHFIRTTSLLLKIKYAAMCFFLPLIHFIIKLCRLYYKYINKKKKMYAYAYGVFFYSWYNMEYFFPVSEIIFEGKKYKAPSNVDKYLVDNFDNNFMVIPEAANRLNHTVRVEFFG